MAKRKEDRDNNGNVHPTRIFNNPQELLDAWNKYKEERQKQSTKWPKIQYVGKEGDRVEDYPVMPLSLKGFYAFCYDNYNAVSVHHYFDNKDGYYDDFGVITSRIKDERDDNLHTGGLLGHYNSNLTAKITDLTERVDQTTNGKEISNQPLQIEIVKPDKED